MDCVTLEITTLEITSAAEMGSWMVGALRSLGRGGIARQSARLAEHCFCALTGRGLCALTRRGLCALPGRGGADRKS